MYSAGPVQKQRNDYKGHMEKKSAGVKNKGGVEVFHYVPYPLDK